MRATKVLAALSCIGSGSAQANAIGTLGLSPGRVSLGAADPAVTAANYCQVIRDLTPNLASDCGRPPRTQFWSRAFTQIHEDFHVTDFRDNYLRPKIQELENYIKDAARCTDCKSDKTAELTTKMEVLYSEAFNDLVTGGLHECRAFGDGVALYNGSIAAIRARANTQSWAACPP